MKTKKNLVQLACFAMLCMLIPMTSCDVATSKRSFEPKQKIQLSQPTINTCKAKSPSKVYLSWSYVPNAEFYGVYYYDLTVNNGTRYLAKGHVTSTSCTVDGFGSEYKLRLYDYC